jgi:hypothetical protein
VRLSFFVVFQFVFAARASSIRASVSALLNNAQLAAKSGAGAPPVKAARNGWPTLPNPTSSSSAKP